MPNLRSIQQVAASEDYPFTEGQLREFVRRADEFEFDPVLVRIGRRVYIDLVELHVWIEKHRGAVGK